MENQKQANLDDKNLTKIQNDVITMLTEKNNKQFQTIQKLRQSINQQKQALLTYRKATDELIKGVKRIEKKRTEAHDDLVEVERKMDEISEFVMKSVTFQPYNDKKINEGFKRAIMMMKSKFFKTEPDRIAQDILKNYSLNDKIIESLKNQLSNK